MATPVIIDCDPGTDDAIAILLALASPELAVHAITVAGGNVGLENTLANALALVALAQSPVPVHAGADRPLLGRFADAVRVHGENGLAGVRLRPGGAAAPDIAADAIRRMLRETAEKLTLIGIGPATNLALVLATEPALAAQVGAIVLMSGAERGGNVTAAAEFNARSDPEALAILLGAGPPVTFAMLELTAQARVTPARIAALRAAGRGACLAAACDILAAVPAPGGGFPLHDPCTVARVIRPGLFAASPAAVSVALAPDAARGQTRIDRAAAPNATLLDQLDADAFFTLLGARLARLP